MQPPSQCNNCERGTYRDARWHPSVAPLIFRNLSLSLGQNRRLLNDQLVYSARRRVELVRL